MKAGTYQRFPPPLFAVALFIAPAAMPAAGAGPAVPAGWVPAPGIAQYRAWANGFIPAERLCDVPAEVPEYRVLVNGREVDVIDIPEPAHHDWQLPDEAALPYWAALFDVVGEASVRIESRSDLSATRILPLSRGIVPRHDGVHAVEFTASPPFAVSVEPRPRLGALVLSAKAPDPDPPSPDDPLVKYFGPGHYHFDKPIRLFSNETLYLAPGAFVDAAVWGSGTNVSVRGHGVLTGFSWQHAAGPQHDLVHLEGADVTVRDVALLGSFGWTLVLNKVDGALIEGVTILGGRVLNDDGMDICRARDVTVRDCFVRTQDDCICAKYWCENLAVERCTLWADVANIFRIGFETDGPPHRLRGIRIRGIDVIHQAVQNDREWQRAVNIQSSNGTVFEDIEIDGLRFDFPNAWDRLAKVQTFIAKSQWRQDKISGQLRGVVFRNVEIPADAPEGALRAIDVWSHDEEHLVRDVSNECTDPRIVVQEKVGRVEAH